jgi:predicted aminopeptidase
MKDPAAVARDESGTVEPADFVVGKRMGSFTDYDAANQLVNATLLRNRERVDRLVEGKSSKDELDATFDSPTGKEAFAPDELADPQSRQTYSVRVVIVADHRTPRVTASIPLFREISTPYRRRRNIRWTFTRAREWR